MDDCNTNALKTNPFCKYYTPNSAIKECLNHLIDHFGLDKLKSMTLIDPCAGDGRWASVGKELGLNIKSYDISPDNDKVEQKDFFTFEKMDNCLILGNPPYGRANNTARQFLIHANKISKYYAFLIPMTFKQNTYFWAGTKLFTKDIITNYEGTQQKVLKTAFILYEQGDNKFIKPICNEIKVYRNWQKPSPETPDFVVGSMGSKAGTISRKLDVVHYDCLVVDPEFKNDKFIDWICQFKVEQIAERVSTKEVRGWEIKTFLNKKIKEYKQI